jgi:hypothetical protein
MLKKVIGVWLDYHEAVIVLVTDRGRDIRRIRSRLEKDASFSDNTRPGAAEDAQHRQFVQRRNQYYDDVIASIREAGYILIFGKGDAPAELSTRMDVADLGGRIVHIAPVDEMTENQIAEKAQRKFRALNSDAPGSKPN